MPYPDCGLHPPYEPMPHPLDLFPNWVLHSGRNGNVIDTLHTPITKFFLLVVSLVPHLYLMVFVLRLNY
jgi:hypothetical protein